jgi:catechol 2,3-dioxygenase-like lactoylglutathione lyase family enzyme
MAGRTIGRVTLSRLVATQESVGPAVRPEAAGRRDGGAEALSSVVSVHVDLVTLVVDDYDPAIEFFVDTMGFELIEDSPSLTGDGLVKRWVVVQPPGGQTGILLAQARGADQSAAVGHQTAGRVGFFLRVEDFDATYERLVSKGVRFVTPPRPEEYGRVAVFLDLAGNRWDLLGPRPTA